MVVDSGNPAWIEPDVAGTSRPLLDRRAAVAALTASITGIAAAAFAPRALASAAPAVPDPTASREEREERVLQRLFEAIDELPENLHDRNTADKEVQDAVVRNYRNSGGLGAAPVVQQVAVTDPGRCIAAIVQFLAENAVPVGKFIRIIREAGGVIKFVRYLYVYVRKRTLPADASQEIIDFIVSLSGVPGVISACA